LISNLISKIKKTNCNYKNFDIREEKNEHGELKDQITNQSDYFGLDFFN